MSRPAKYRKKPSESIPAFACVRSHKKPFEPTIRRSEPMPFNRLQLCVPPCVTYDDLVGAGTIGLIQAVDRFQPARGLQFGTYARHRIRGAMLDYLREEDPLSRTERRRIRAAEATSAATGEKTVSATISLEWLPAHELRKVCARAGCPSSQLADRADLRRARRALSARENRVISLLYELDWKNRDVAWELGVTAK